MQYVAVAVTAVPMMVDAVAVVSAVRTTVQTVRWMGSWAAWAVLSAPPETDVAWQLVEGDGTGGAVVDAEVLLVNGR